MEPVKIFTAYARIDQPFVDKVKACLSHLIKRKIVEFWYDAELKPGEVWEDRIKEKLGEADIILLFISMDFLGSEYITSIELPKAMERKRNNAVEIVPIVIRNCNWHFEPEIAQLQVIPEGGKPVKSWPDEDSCYTQISKELTSLIDRLRLRRLIQQGADLDNQQFFQPETVFEVLIEAGDRRIAELQFDQAVEFYQKSIKLHKSNFSSSLEMVEGKIKNSHFSQNISIGNVLFNDKRYKEALKRFELALENYVLGFEPPSNHVEEKIQACRLEILREQIKNHYQKGNYPAALADLEKARAIRPDGELETLRKELEKYVSDKEKFETLIEEARNLEHFNWPECLQKYKNSLKYFHPGFAPSEKEINQKIEICQQSINDIQQQAQQTANNKKLFAKAVDNGKKAASAERYKEAVNYYKTALTVFENPFKPDQKTIKEQIKLWEEAQKKVEKKREYEQMVWNAENTARENLLGKEKAIDLYRRALELFEPGYSPDKTDIQLKINLLGISLKPPAPAQTQPAAPVKVPAPAVKQPVAPAKAKTPEKLTLWGWFWLIILIFGLTTFSAFLYSVITYKFFFKYLHFSYINFLFLFIPLFLGVLFHVVLEDYKKPSYSRVISIGYAANMVLFLLISYGFQFYWSNDVSFIHVFNFPWIITHIEFVQNTCYRSLSTFAGEIAGILLVAFTAYFISPDT